MLGRSQSTDAFFQRWDKQVDAVDVRNFLWKRLMNKVGFSSFFTPIPGNFQIHGMILPAGTACEHSSTPRLASNLLLIQSLFCGA
jgi:hypothetical protein